MPSPKSSIQKTQVDHAAKAGVAKAYGLLIDQPASAAQFDTAHRNAIIISAVVGDDGTDVILSRYGDSVWELWPYVTTPNIAKSKTRLGWTGLPESFREVCKAVIFRYLKVGNPGWGLPGVASLIQVLKNLRVICRYFASIGIKSLADVQLLHIANFVHFQKTEGLAPTTLLNRFCAIEMLYTFRDQHPDGLRCHPWPESSASEVAGVVGAGYMNARSTGKTPLIPGDVAQALFLHAERILQGADAILDERDSGKRPALKDREFSAIRNACFYLLGVLTGMRSSELSSIEVGATRTEIKNGYTFHWIKSVEHKTKKGPVEYLMPSMGLDILRVLERWSEPYRRKLAERLAAWEAEAGSHSAMLQDISLARANRNRLFLGLRDFELTTMSGNGWLVACRDFARQAGVDWKLTPHQMRRLYAYTFVRHRLGDMLFLKEQFKHSCLDMTQLYASNPLQDTAIYDEILEEMSLYKAEVVCHWLEKDEPLAGGAGRKIMAMRAHDFPNRAAMITETSGRINIRSTGHSWCLAQDEGCGGSGIYERGRCDGCHNGLIDSRFIPVWHEAYRHTKELLEDAKALGPGAFKRVERDLEQATGILKALGVPIDQGGMDDQVAG